MSDTPIPAHELTTLRMSVFEANDMAGVGETYDGLRCLLGGQARAQEAADDGEPWGAALVAEYRKALDAYGEKWGIRVE